MWCWEVYRLIWSEWEYYLSLISILMRKFVIVLCTLIIGYSIYALSPSLFPDTPNFPRIPTSPGTVGSILSEIVGWVISDATDGTVANTAKLDGITATGYLKNTSCSVTEKWIGIDASGKAICGTSNPILANYGTISEQGCAAQIFHADNSIPWTTNTGDTLKSWDILKTGACGLTIAFADYSILRLDADTTVSLDLLESPTDGRTIASAILSNGSLWWRILTDTGSYSIGTDKIVAWVRGTSIAVTSTGNTITIAHASPSTGKAWTISSTLGANNTEVAIVDSTNNTPDNPAATVYCRNSTSTPLILSGLSPENTYSIPNTGCATTPQTVSAPPANLYARSAWVRTNTRNDITYMYRLLGLGYPSIATSKIAKLSQELTLSSPPDSPTSPETQNICENSQKWWTIRYGCQSSSLYGIADYTLPVPSGMATSLGTAASLLYSWAIRVATETLGGGAQLGLNGIAITASGQYLQYTDPALIAGLAGKTVTIELENPVPTPATGKNYVLDLGSYRLYKNTVGAFQYQICSSPPAWCAPATTLSAPANTTILTMTIPPSLFPSQFIIGNQYIPSSPAVHLISPIKTTIKKILVY